MRAVSTSYSSSSLRNYLLAALLPADFALLQPHLRPMALALKQDIERPNRRIESVCFMESGIASVVATHSETRVEVGLVGCEGMSGTAIVLGGDRGRTTPTSQVAGQAQQIKAHELREAMNASESLRSVLLKFVQAFMVQTAHTAIANARSHIDQRLARWILMAHDRTHDNNLPLTHEFLALMLGVRRGGVTDALQSLKRRKLIDTGRNHRSAQSERP